MVNYNMSFMDGATDYLQVFEGVNTATDGLISGLLLLVVFIVMFVILVKTNNDISTSVLVASFVCSVFSLFFYVLGVVATEIFIIPIIILIIGIFMKTISR